MQPCLYLVVQHLAGGAVAYDGCPLQDAMKLGYTMDPDSLYPRYRTPYSMMEIIVFLAPPHTSVQTLVQLEKAWHEHMHLYRVRQLGSSRTLTTESGSIVHAGGTEIFRTSMWGYCRAVAWARANCGPMHDLALEANGVNESTALVDVLERQNRAATQQAPPTQAAPHGVAKFGSEAEFEFALNRFLQPWEVHPCRAQGAPRAPSAAEKDAAMPVPALAAQFAQQCGRQVVASRFAPRLYRHFDEAAKQLGYKCGSDLLAARRGHKGETVIFLRKRVQ